VGCPVEELNRHTRAYNSRYDKEIPEITGEQLTAEQAERLHKEVPSYQPGPSIAGGQTVTGHMTVYRQQLTDIFRRAWKERAATVPVDKWAEIAAHEAVEYFWTTFKRNEQFEAGVREFKSL
jgi:putative SOS response-associated peptidase YedK